jgi:hypothetical protein
MKRPKIGDIIEISTSRGCGYALFTHNYKAPPKFGALIRVFAGLYTQKPDSWSVLINRDILFSTFFPLGAYVNRGSVEIVGHTEIPLPLQGFPIFRCGTPNAETKRVDNWWLWDGIKEWRVGKLTPEQAIFPLRGTWNDILLIERIEQQWRAETDPVWAAFPLN